MFACFNSISVCIFLGDHSFSFLYAVDSMDADYTALSPTQFINHFKHMGPLTTKSGLLRSLVTNAYWESGYGIGLDWCKFHPFTFNLGAQGKSRHNFDLLFRLDCCRTIIEQFVSINSTVSLPQSDPLPTSSSFPRLFNNAHILHKHINIPGLILALQFAEYVISMPERPGWSPLYGIDDPLSDVDSTGSVPVSSISSFLLPFKDILKWNRVVPLYVPPSTSPVLNEQQWYIVNRTCVLNPTETAFLSQYIDSTVTIPQTGVFAQFPRVLLQSARIVLPKLTSLVSPIIPLGNKGLWIIKPQGGSCGHGIECLKSLYDLTKYLQDALKEKVFMLQKYIEHPLLIHRYKFDIRQWVLITSLEPLTIWMYTEPYVRIASIPFTSDDTSRFIHLTNHAVQKSSPKYGKSSDGPEFLRHGCMMNYPQFNEYLQQLESGQLNPAKVAFVPDAPPKQAMPKFSTLFREKTLPLFEQIVTTTILSGRDCIEPRLHTYDVVGFDFMIDDEMNPWLLEVTLSPSFKHDTEIVTPIVEDGIEGIMKGLSQLFYCSLHFLF